MGGGRDKVDAYMEQYFGPAENYIAGGENRDEDEPQQWSCKTRIMSWEFNTGMQLLILSPVHF